jgi:hypothetical protein
VLARVPTSAQQGGGLRTSLPTLAPVGFYGVASAVGSAVRAVTSWTVRRPLACACAVALLTLG